MSKISPPKGRLAAEIRLTKPFPSPETEAFLSLLRTAGLMADQVAQLCKSEGISSPQYNALRILRGAGPNGLLCGEVAERLVNRLPDISRLLNRLHEIGLIRKHHEPHDRRAVRVTLSKKGSRALDRLDQPLLELHGHQFSELSEKELHTLLLLLEKARPQEETTAE